MGWPYKETGSKGDGASVVMAFPRPGQFGGRGQALVFGHVYEKMFTIVRVQLGGRNSSLSLGQKQPI